MKEGGALQLPAVGPGPALRIVREPGELLRETRPVCAALGFFDGVHLGHQAVLAQAMADAREQGGLPVVVTFDVHPSAVLAPDHAAPLLYPLEKRLETLEECGMGAALLLHFDAALSRVGAREFVQRLAASFGRLSSVSVGVNFGFGHRRSGNLDLLRDMCGELGFKVHGVAPVDQEGQAISSTRVRELVLRGRFELAGKLLGRPYHLAGRVIGGDRRGRQLGFPTANLDVAGLAIPPNGVYATRAWAGGERHPSVTNIGRRPTVATPGSPVTVETHLLDFAGDLYGQPVELEFLAKLRDEIKFSSLQELQTRIEADTAAARGCF
jgi:riboflavin kinase/FMN adenylyltransferase